MQEGKFQVNWILNTWATMKSCLSPALPHQQWENIKIWASQNWSHSKNSIIIINIVKEVNYCKVATSHHNTNTIDPIPWTRIIIIRVKKIRTPGLKQEGSRKREKKNKKRKGERERGERGSEGARHRRCHLLNHCVSRQLTHLQYGITTSCQLSVIG